MYAAVVTILLCAIAFSVVESQGVINERNSFKPPFDTYTSNGVRVIEGWVVGGDATISQNYVRLTRDRASKRGWMYNSFPTPSSDWTLELKFRISGQGQTLFGDGMALWVSPTPYSVFAKGGSAFGVPDTIEGFGILFDTYKNVEIGNRHKDIMLVVGDGEKPMEMHNVLPTGCKSKYRYWEKRDDFNIGRHSIAVIDYKGSEKLLRVRIDARANGNMNDCFEFKFTNEGAAKLADMSKMHIAMSSSTGQLADNHDVLSVQLRNYGDESAGTIEPKADPSQYANQVSVSTQSYVNAHVERLQDRITFLEHELEHKVDAIADELRAMIDKIKKAEEDDKKRIDELQEKVTDAVMREAADGIGELVVDIVDDAVKDQKRDLVDSISSQTQAMTQKLASIQVGGSDKSWLLPFLILSIAMCTVSYVAYSKWNRFMKTHLP
eukprot:g6263.t1